VLRNGRRDPLLGFAKQLEPYANRIDRAFQERLRTLGFDVKQKRALLAITPTAAARILAAGDTPLNFIEQVEYNCRRLAKLNLPPTAILGALKEHEAALVSAFNKHAAFQRVREQLHFSIVLTLNNAYYQVREAETQSFYDQFRIELEARNLDELLRRFLDSLVQLCRADTGSIYMLDEESKAWVPKAGSAVPNHPALQRKLGQPRCLNLQRTGSGPCLSLDHSWPQRFVSCWSVPFIAAGRIEGVMQFAFRKKYEWLPRERELLAAAAERCLMAAQKMRLMEDLARREEQVRSLAGHMLHVEEVERRRISHELHDEAGQSLLCIRLQMEMLEQKLPREAREWRNQLRQARDLTERTILEMRRLIAALSPAVLEQLGLGAALRQLVARFQRLHSCRVRLQLSKIERLPPQMETIAYRLVQECFNNIGKHSGATAVDLDLSSTAGRLRLCVEDNGRGFRLEEAFAKRESFGLSGMRERVTLLNGDFRVESRMQGSKTGTKISIELPIST